MPTSEFSLEELDELHAILLPQREALAFFNWAGIVANNQALALNAVTAGSFAAAAAVQTIAVVQG
jgi:hypothetical protein